jgi:mono/diheme cytochrome c family protein
MEYRYWAARIGPVLSLAGTLMVTMPAYAQDDFEETLGASEYQANCASCHGTTGKGDGPLAGELKTPPSDLTGLLERNDGSFPFFETYDVIAGNTVVTPHGDPDMPVWGTRLTYDTERSLEFGPPYPEGAVREIVEGRILRIVYYLRSIQEE